MLDFTCIVKKKTYYISPVKVYALCSTYIFALRFNNVYEISLLFFLKLYYKFVTIM